MECKLESRSKLHFHVPVAREGRMHGLVACIEFRTHAYEYRKVLNCHQPILQLELDVCTCSCISLQHVSSSAPSA